MSIVGDQFGVGNFAQQAQQRIDAAAPTPMQMGQRIGMGGSQIMGPAQQGAQARLAGLGQSVSPYYRGQAVGGPMAPGAFGLRGLNRGAGNFGQMNRPPGQFMAQDYRNMNGGVAFHGAPGSNAVQQAQSQGPNLQQIQADMARRQVGTQLGGNPQNAALAGFMMGQ